MADAASTTPQTPLPPARAKLGDRVRQLRIARGLTQTELAGERCSKEYVSQIERGKTRPTGETIAWIAERLAVDATFLEVGVSTSERERVEGVIARAEAGLESMRWDDAVGQLAGVGDALGAVGAPELDLRALLAESWARMHLGEIRQATALLERARSLAEGAEFSDHERAEVLFRIGCCRTKMPSVATSIALFTQALELTERSGLPADRLRSQIYEWRARCHERQRDFEAAREDVERALALGEILGDRRQAAGAYLRASARAEDAGHYALARRYAERAKSQLEELADQANLGRQLRKLGAFTFLLGKPEEAVAYLNEAFRVAIEVDSRMDAAHAVSSLAQVHQRLGENELAEDEARHALELLGDREGLLDEIGNAQLVLGRALLDQDRLEEAGAAFAEAERRFSQLSSGSHRAMGWIAQGDLAARLGDDRGAALLYRRAAETLQDLPF